MICSCQISLESESYESVTRFVKVELREQRLYRTTHLKSSSSQHLLCCVVHVSRPWVVMQGGRKVSICSSGLMGTCVVAVALDVSICPYILAMHCSN